MSTTSMAIFSNPLFATYSVYARNASIIVIVVKAYENISFRYKSNWDWQLKNGQVSLNK